VLSHACLNSPAAPGSVALPDCRIISEAFVCDEDNLEAAAQHFEVGGYSDWAARIHSVVTRLDAPKIRL